MRGRLRSAALGGCRRRRSRRADRRRRRSGRAGLGARCGCAAALQTSQLGHSGKQLSLQLAVVGGQFVVVVVRIFELVVIVFVIRELRP